MAAVPLLPGALPPRATPGGRLSDGQRAVRAPAHESARAGRCGVGARLSADFARPSPAPAQLQWAHRLFPAHPLSARADPAPAAELHATRRRPVSVRPARLSDPG